MTDDEIIAVVQAHKEGKQIQTKCIYHDSEWQDINTPEWQFGQNLYRVKPEPRKLREWWVVVDSNGMVTGQLLRPDKPVLTGHSVVRVREVSDIIWCP